jgi:hypothetical protein
MHAGMAKTRPTLVSIGTFWLISFARGGNLSRRIISGFHVPSPPCIPWCHRVNFTPWIWYTNIGKLESCEPRTSDRPPSTILHVITAAQWWMIPLPFWWPRPWSQTPPSFHNDQCLIKEDMHMVGGVWYQSLGCGNHHINHVRLVHKS